VSGLAQTRAALRDIDDTRRRIDEALKRSRAIAQGLCDLTDALRCVAALLDRLKPWVDAGMIDNSDLDPVAQSIETLRDRCRELGRLASARSSAANSSDAGCVRALSRIDATAWRG